MIERIAILGTGLLGTSVGLALRAAGFRGAIVGWNRSPKGAQTALAGLAGEPQLDPMILAVGLQRRGRVAEHVLVADVDLPHDARKIFGGPRLEVPAARGLGEIGKDIGAGAQGRLLRRVRNAANAHSDRVQRDVGFAEHVEQLALGVAAMVVFSVGDDQQSLPWIAAVLHIAGGQVHGIEKGRLAASPDPPEAVEYVRGIEQDIHRAGKLMMANGAPDRLWWLAPMLDVLGTETNWNPQGKWRPMSDADLLYRRAMCKRWWRSTCSKRTDWASGRCGSFTGAASAFNVKAGAARLPATQ